MYIENYSGDFMKKAKIIYIIIIICLFMAWLIPCMIYNILTWQHGNEFIGLHETTGIISDVDYLKVLDYSKSSAHVYYVGNSGNILTFVNNGDKWELLTWDTIWSKSGSADSFIWPYFYHSEGGLSFIFLISIFLIPFLSILWLITISFIRDRKIKHER